MQYPRNFKTNRPQKDTVSNRNGVLNTEKTKMKTVKPIVKETRYFVKCEGRYVSSLFSDNKAKTFATDNKELAYFWNSKEIAERVASQYEGATIEVEEILA